MDPLYQSSPHIGLLSAEAAARLKQFKEYAIAHPLLQQVDRQLTHTITEPAGFAFVLVYGPSGVGKTTMIQQVERRYHAALPSSPLAFLPRLGHLPEVPLLLMETRPPDGATFHRADYYRTALKQLGEQTYERQTLVDIDVENSWEQKTGRGGSPRGKAAQFHDAPELRHAMEDALVRRGMTQLWGIMELCCLPARTPATSRFLFPGVLHINIHKRLALIRLLAELLEGCSVVVCPVKGSPIGRARLHQQEGHLGKVSQTRQKGQR